MKGIQNKIDQGIKIKGENKRFDYLIKQNRSVNSRFKN